MSHDAAGTMGHRRGGPGGPRRLARGLVLALAVLAGGAWTSEGCSCDPGAYIPISAATWSHHCGDPVPLGGTCLLPDECAEGLRCVASKCAPLATAGQTCATQHDCVAGLGCHQIFHNDGTCLATDCSLAGHQLPSGCVTSGPSGRTCGGDLICSTPFEVCQLNSTVTTDCRSLPGEGQSCDGFMGYTCAPGLICELVTNVCKRPLQGGTCGVTGEDQTGACGPDLGCGGSPDRVPVCLPRVPAGGACDQEACVAGYHCSVSTRRCEQDQAAGTACSAGNECGAALGRRVDCAASRCTAVDQRGAACWPGHYGCVAGLRCLKDR